MIEALVRMPASEALGWTLLHSLWQGAIAALFVALVRPSRARYMAGCVALAALLCMFIFTFSRCLPDNGAATGTWRVGTAPVSGADANALAATASEYGDHLAWLAPLWIMGVGFFQVRTTVAWMAAERLRRRGVCRAPQAWRLRLMGLAARMCVSEPVQLLESALVKMPVVVGYLRPAILMPAGLLSAMRPEQIEAILLHELAHIRRHDYLVNLLQALVEGLLFYHPAAWWISAVIRAEREHCCDDLAAAAIGADGAYEYALALTALEASRLGTGLESAAGVAAAGGNLMRRIQRMLYPQEQGRAAAAGWAMTPAVVTVALAVAVAWQVSAVPQQPQQQEAPYMKWVNEDVVYIIEPREREVYLRLQTDEEREHFIEQFWQRRDPTAGTAKNEFKEEHYRRIGFAMERFRSANQVGWKTDRGRIYIVYGPPDEMESHPAGRGGGPPSEQWLYKYIEGIGEGVIVEFVDVNRDGGYRQTRAPNTRN
jgi:GWxTD domain-containing protein